MKNEARGWEIVEHDHETASGYVEIKVVATRATKKAAEQEAHEWRAENRHLNVRYTVEPA
jgi:TolB-like protein